MNYTNPVPRLCLAVERYTDISVLGLCHEVEHEMKRLAPIMGMPFSLLDAVSAGLNHFSWFKELRLTNGDDAYPLLDEGLKGVDVFQPPKEASYLKMKTMLFRDTEGYVLEILEFLKKPYGL